MNNDSSVQPNFFKKWIQSIVAESLSPFSASFASLELAISELEKRQNEEILNLKIIINSLTQEQNNELSRLDANNIENSKVLDDLQKSVQVLSDEYDLLKEHFDKSSLDHKKMDENHLETKEDFERRIFQVEENVRLNNKKWEDETKYLELESLLNAQGDKLNQIKDEVESLRIFIAKECSKEDIKHEFSMPKSQKILVEGSPSTYELIDYFDFENHFRGTRDEIKERQRFYLPYFKDKNNILDLGCGRGEFVELLKESNIRATGIDNYPEFVKYCQGRNLPVICGDALEALEGSQDIDGIFAAQFVEHLSQDQLQLLCKLAFENLSNNGCFIVETPNPMSLAIYTHAFYMDPSHTKPVHPFTLQYILQKSGFRDVQIVFLPSSKLPVQIPKLNIEGNDSVNEFNLAMETVSDTLFGSQDYAIIAQK